MKTFLQITNEEILDILNTAMDNGDWHTPSAADINLHELSNAKCAYGWFNISKHNTYRDKEMWLLVFKRNFVGNNIRFIKERTTLLEPRWVLSSGVERLGIQMNGEVWYDSDLQTYKFNQHLVTLLLLSKGFDLFGLIEAGLAIDKTTNQ